MLKLCLACGHGNAADALYCSSCGIAIEASSPPPAASSGPPDDPTTEVSAVADGDDDNAGSDGAAQAGAGTAGPGAGSQETPAASGRAAFGADQGLFVVRQGPKAGARYALDDDLVTVGRHPQSTIFLDDITVSRRHAEVRRSQSVYAVRDVGSLNGTYVNRKRVEEAALTDGDEIQIGRFKLVFMHGTRR